MSTAILDQASARITRDIRQREIIPPEQLASSVALVIGVGAIGRQVAVQLAAIGMPVIELFDPDTVGIENLAPQAYYEDEVGMAKVLATAAMCRRLNPSVELITHTRRFRRSSPRELAQRIAPQARLAAFCCVDSIDTRRLIWETVRERAAFLVDGRMSAEVIRVLAVDRPDSASSPSTLHYPTTLFAAGQAYAGSCTAKATVYTAAIAAGLMLSAFTRWLRGLPLECDVILNLLAGEWTVS